MEDSVSWEKKKKKKKKRYKTSMKEHLEYFGSNVKADKIIEIQSEVENVKQVMLKNLDEIIERG